MDMKQVIILLLGVSLLVRVRAQCYDDTELSAAAERKLRRHYPQPPETPATPAAGCPLELYRQRAPQQLSDRSVSPWRYVLKTMPDHFPSNYTEAQCLCSGCILLQHNNVPVESHNYNSVPVTQTRVFLKKEQCGNGRRDMYHLKPVTVDVTVGCTCARAKTSS